MSAVRFDRLGFWIVVIVTALGTWGGTPLAEAARPNVLFIAVDDLRPELGCYGKSHIHSPNIDALAKDGVVFERAYCQQAVCSPSRTSLLTGRRPDTTKVYDLETHFRDTIGHDVVTLPQQFKNHGWHVAGMGKIYHGGFDDPKSWSVPWRGAKGSPNGLVQYGRKENAELVAGKRKTFKAKGRDVKNARGPAAEASDVADNAFHDGALADMAIATLGELEAKDEPFFLAVGFIRPHLPFVAPQKYWDLYDRDDVKLPERDSPPKDAPPFALANFGELRRYHGMPAKGPLSDEQARELIHGYYACVSYMDAQVGRVIDELKRLKRYDDTIIVLWGDHGWKLGDYGEWCKHSNMERDTHVPLIVRSPGAKANGRSSPALVEFVDIFPSLCELAGLPLTEGLEGTSFAPLLDEPDQPWKTAAFSQYPRSADGRRVMGYSMRTDRYRLTRWVTRDAARETVAVELYDHETDPEETVNVAGEAGNASVVERLTEQLEAGWREARGKTAGK